MEFQSLSKEELSRKREELQARYEGYKAQGLKLNMARGKPSAEQAASGSDEDFLKYLEQLKKRKK